MPLCTGYVHSATPLREETVNRAWPSVQPGNGTAKMRATRHLLLARTSTWEMQLGLKLINNLENCARRD